MRRKRAPETQNLLAALKARMALKGARSEDIVAEFARKHPEIIRRENNDLVHMALMKLVGTVGAGTKGSAAQLELFTEYNIPKTILFRDSHGSKVHRQTLSLTIAEAREHILERTKPRVNVPDEIKELARLLDDVDSYKVSEQSTIGDSWISYQQAHGG